MKKRLFGILAILLYTLTTNAQVKQDSIKTENLNEIFLESKFNSKRKHAGKTVIKISSNEIQQQAGKSIVELINSKSGIEINGSRSNASQNLGIYARGGNNRQVLILMDGIAMNDPSHIANDYDLRLIDLNQVHSIEIIKGASSTLYGSNAATAVISITSKKANKNVLTGNFSSQIGTHNNSIDSDNNIADFSNHININGTKSNFNYLVSFAHHYSDGFSAIENGTERDDFGRISVNTKLGYDLKKISINLFANHSKIKSNYDDAFNFIDENYIFKSEQNRIGLATNYKYNNGLLKAIINYNVNTRDFEDSFPRILTSKNFSTDIYNAYSINKTINLITGVQYTNNEAEFDNEKIDAQIIDPYANIKWISDFGLNLNAGIRLNNHSEYDNHLTYNINPSYTYNFNNSYVKLLASYSTAYIAPSLYQLDSKSPYILPNLNLDPEENTTIEAGFEVKLNNNIRMNIIGFNREEKNFIDFYTDPVTFQSQYQNINTDFTVKGIEVEIAYQPTTKIDLNANYTFTEKEDVIALRIPKHKANFYGNYKLNNKTNFGLNYQFTSNRTDSFYNSAIFASENVELDSFQLVDFLFNTELIKDRLKFNASITNILNEEYQEIYRFNTKGRNYKIGFNLTF